MGQARGYLSTLVMDWETAYGVAPASPAGLAMPYNSCGLKGNLEQSAPGTITASRNPVEPSDGNLPVDGPLVVPVDTTAFAHWLRAMFGLPATTGSGPYVHTFTVGDLQPSFLIDRKFADPAAAIVYVRHNGVKIGSWRTAIAGAGGELTAELQLHAGGETKGAAPYDPSPAAVTLARLQMKPCTVTEGGAGLAGIVKEADFTVNFGLDTDQFTVDAVGGRGDIPEGVLTVEGNVTALFKNTALLDKAFAGTKSSLAFEWVAGGHGLKVEFPEIRYGRSIPEAEGPKGVLLRLPFHAFYASDPAASAVKAVLTNNVASYS
jgi:hypothetical protein